MSVEGLARACRQVAAEVLQAAGFALAEPAERAPEWEGELVQASMSFAGRTRGRLFITASVAFGKRLAASVIGSEPDGPGLKAEVPGSLCDILSAIAGSLLVRWFGSHEVCYLGIPLAKTLAPASPEANPANAAFRVTLLTEEQERVDLAATFEAQP